MSMRRLTPWFPASAKPVRPGRYRAQEKGMRCSCWIELEWRNGEWFSDLCERDRYTTHFFESNLKRWRGLTAPERAAPTPFQREVLRQQKAVRKEFKKLAEIYPGCFTKDGTPIVAVLPRIILPR